MSDDSGDTSPSQPQRDMFKYNREVRDDTCATLTIRLHLDRFKLVKEVRNDRGDTSVRCAHPTNCKACKATRDDKGDMSASWLRRSGSRRAKSRYNAFSDINDDKGDTSTSCGLQSDRSRICNLTIDEINLTSSSSLYEDISSSYRQAHNQ